MEAAPRSKPGRRWVWAAAITGLALALATWFAWSLAKPTRAPDARVAETVADAGTALPPSVAPRELQGERVLLGSVRDDQDKPLASALVRVASLDDPEILPKQVRSDEAGNFRLEGLPAEPLSLEASAVGHDTVEHVLRPEDPGPLALVLQRQGELLVTLRDAPGSRLLGTQMLLTGTGLWPAASCFANDQGSCLFEGLPGGQYQARARSAGRIARASAPLEVIPGQRAQVELTLEEGATVHGVLRDHDSGQAIAGGRISVQDLTPGLEPVVVVSEGDGKFSLAGLWPGAARLEAVAEGYAPRSLELRLPIDEPLAIGLKGSASLAGRVIDEGGRPVQGALLSVSSREGLPVAVRLGQEATIVPGELGVTRGPVPHIPLSPEHAFALGTLAAESDAAGAFRIEGLEPGSVILRVSRPGYAAVTLSLEPLPPHARRDDLEIVLRVAGRVAGRVLDARQRGVGGVYVAAIQGEQAEQSGITDERGEFLLRDVLGDVTVRVQPEGRAPLECRLNVTAQATARCDVSIASELFELPVRVVDDYGFGLDGVVVSLRAKDMRHAFTQVSQRDGRLRLRELPAPPYLLSAEHAGFLSLEDEPVEHADREVRVTLRRAARIGGSVVDSLGRPVPLTFVSTDDGDATAETDEHGSFALTQVAPGVLTLWASHPEAGEAHSAAVRARAGETLPNIRIVLPRRYDGPARPSDEPARAPAKERETSAPPPPARARASEKPADFTMEQHPNAVVVTSVAQGGAAAKAGLRVGDVIAAVDGEAVLSAAHARGMLRDPPNTHARVRLLRGRQPVDVRYRRPAL